MYGPLNLTSEEALERLRQAVEASDVVRASHLRMARTLESAKEVRLGVEARRLEMKHGPESPLVEAVRARAAAVEALPALLGAEVERAGVRPPEPDRGELVVHGRVVDTEGRGIRGATVVALDASDTEVKRRRTGPGGRFELRIEAPPSPVEGEAGERAKRAGKREAEAAGELRLAVLQDEEEVGRGPTDLPTEAGTVVYREVAVQPRSRRVAAAKETPASKRRARRRR